MARKIIIDKFDTYAFLGSELVVWSGPKPPQDCLFLIQKYTFF